MNSTSLENQPKIGAWKGGWLLARSSWTTLRLSRELIGIQLLSLLAGGFILGIFWGIIKYSGLSTDFVSMIRSEEVTVAWVWGLILIAFYLIQYIVGNFFSSGLIAAVLQRFQGNTPTLRYAMSRAWDRFGPVAAFSLITSTVGIVVSAIENNERVPVLGKIIASLSNVAWNLATLFTIPAIMGSETKIGSMSAIQQSSKVFKNTWGQNFVGGLGLGLLSLIGILPVSAALLTTLFIAYTTQSILLYGVSGLIGLLWLLVIIITSTLGTIFTTALYYFATTGEAPDSFDKRLLQAAFKPKKKWFK